MAALSSSVADDAPVDLKNITRERVRSEIRAAAASSSTWMVAVLDKAATRVISSVVTMYDIMEERVTLVESLELKRQPFPEMGVIYFMSSAEASVKRLVADFSDAPCYGDVHVFFLSKVGSAAMSLLQGCPALISRMKTFKEINIDFLSVEPHVFHLDERPSCFGELYGDARPPPGLVPFAERVAGKLLTMCSSLHEYPIVRCRPNSPMEAVGRILLGMLDDLVASSSWWYHGSAGHAERLQGTLLLLDRTEDSVSPALHFCTYQALVNDLLNVRDGNVITIKAKDKEKEVLLNEKDELWVKFRHMHIADVLGGLSEYLDSIKARNPQAVKVASGADGTTIEDMSKFVKAMPEYQAQLDVYSQHLQIAQSCMSHIQAGGQALLNLITDVEQTLATGFDPNGKALRLPLVIDSLLDEMASDNAQLKLRLVLILAASQREKLSEADLDRVCTAAGFTAEERSTVSTLRSLDATSVEPTSGGESSSSTGKKKGKWTFSKKLFSSSSSSSSSAASAAAPAESDFASSRFVCPIKAIAEDLVNGKLSATDFPPLPSGAAIVETKAVAQSVRRSPGWGAKSKPAFSGARSIIFMAGGVAFAELQAVALASTESNKEIILGGTSILTQKGFIEALASV